MAAVDRDLAKLTKLRAEIADLTRARMRLVGRRDRIIVSALEAGATERAIGAAAGISSVAVHKKRPKAEASP